MERRNVLGRTDLEERTMIDGAADDKQIHNEERDKTSL